jgi:hypothetical protein
MTKTDFETHLRPEVKGAITADGTVWLATLAGLYRWVAGEMHAIPEWQGKRLRAICKAPGGLLLSHEDGLTLCNKEGRVRRELPPMPEDEAKSVLMSEGIVIAGGKTGIWRLEDERWTRVQQGKPYEVIGLGKSGGRLVAHVKKQGPAQCPALAISADFGRTWRHAYEGTYADLARGIYGDLIVTQWGGPHRLGETPAPRKEPVTAATMAPGLVALVGGSKLELHHGGRVRLELKHPAFAEAETLVVQGSQALVAGVQGAYLVDLNTGGVRDLFQGVAVPSHAAKVKKLFSMGDGRMLATATFGTFVSKDSGASWHPAASDWMVLDAVGLAQESGDRWWLATQRALFSSADGGQSWKHAKVSGRPHGFAEFTGIAFAQGRLALATKAGLFVSGPGGIKDLAAIPALGRRLIEGVAVDGDRVFASDGAGGLFAIAPGSGAVTQCAQLPPKTSPLAVTKDGLLLAGKQGLTLWRDGALRAIDLPEPLSDLHATASGGRLLVWSGDKAWSRALEGGAWVPVADWPRGVKSASLLAERGEVLATDRNTLYRRKAA